MHAPPQLPPVVYAVFSGEINQESVRRIITGTTSVMGQVQHVHLLFQSNGGYIGDGICLYAENIGGSFCLSRIVVPPSSPGVQQRPPW